MTLLARVRSWFVALFFRSRMEREMEQEWQFHVDSRVAELVSHGRTRSQAEEQARLEFGATIKWKEESWDARGLTALDEGWGDVRHAVRQMARAPGFTLVIIATLALGIGAATAVFSVVNGVMLRPLPFTDSDRLVRIVDNAAPADAVGGGRVQLAGVNTGEMLALRARARELSHIGAYASFAMTMTTSDVAVRLDGVRISPTLLELLAPRPALGRTFSPVEEAVGADGVVVLSHTTWQRYFSGRADVIGQVVRLEARGYTVVGVMDPSFRFPNAQTQFWVPFALGTPGPQPRLLPVARLADGSTLETAAAELAAILGPPPAASPPAPPSPGAAMPSPPPSDRPASPSDGSTRATPLERRLRLVGLADEIAGPVRPALRLLGVAVGLVLLIACVNVANLLLARSSVRRREMAIRLALGAGRGRLIRQLLTESVLLSLLGGAAATGLALAGTQLLRAIGSGLPRRDMGSGVGLPRIDEIAIDLPTLVFTLVLSLITGLLFGLVPAGQSHGAPGEALRDGTASSVSGFHLLRRNRARGLLVMAQIGMAVMLVVGSGLLIRSFATLSSVDPGYEPSSVLTFHVSLAGGRSASARLPRFAEDLVDRLGSVRGVRAAAYTEQLPMVQRRTTMPLRRSAEVPSVVPPPPAAPGGLSLPEFPDVRMVSRDYFQTMGIRVIAGRGLDVGDGAGHAHVMVINESLARSGFFDGDPVGQQVYGPGPTPWHVVGIVEDVRQFGLDQEPGPQVFVDTRQVLMNGLAPTGAVEYFTIRTDGDPTALVAIVRDLARQIDPVASIDNVATMEQIVANSVSRQRLFAVLLAVFAAVAVALAAVGIYGVMAYAVAQRAREMGIRIALGAERSRVLVLVVTEALVVTGIGTAAGLVGAIMMSRALRGMLFGIGALDPPTFLCAAVLLPVVATLAAFVPARRATQIDPLVALHCD